jgi:serine/threonine protein kinase
MSKIEIWEKYEKKEEISNGTYGKILKAKNKETGYYVAIKEIEKEKYNKINGKIFDEKDIINKILLQDNFCLKEIFNLNDYYYIVMDLCINNLEDYIKNRENEFSINEIKEILNQINNNLKKIQNEKYIYKSLKLSNLLISINQIDRILIKCSNFDLIKFDDKLNLIFNEIPFTVAPEILINNLISNKSIIWNLGILIYFIIFKEYPYNGKNKEEFINDIKTKKKIKLIKNNELNDLLSKMLKINLNERISWDDYLNHSFFKTEKFEFNNLPQFDFYCKYHNKNKVIYYCKNCEYNFCENCLNEHNSKNHFVIPFSKIGLINEEKSKIKNLLKKLEKNFNYFNKIKSEIHSLFDKMKLIKENMFIYENDMKNNYKKYYIDVLYIMNEKIKIEKNKINIIDLSINNNEIINSTNKTNEINNLKNNDNSDTINKSNDNNILNNNKEPKDDSKNKDINK